MTYEPYRRRWQPWKKRTSFKKSDGDLHKGVKDRIAAIRRLSGQHKVKVLCNVLCVSRSTYYAAISRPISARAKENDELSRRIREIWSRSRQRYGYPKVAEQLRREGIQVSDRRVWRIMSEMGIKSITIKRFKAHGGSQDKAERTNELKQDFYADRPNLKWATDITYIPTHNDGWTYLASVLDLCTRKIIGWSYGKRATAELAVSALELALGNQGHLQGVRTRSQKRRKSETQWEIVNHAISEPAEIS